MDSPIQCPFNKSHQILKSRLQYHMNREHGKVTSKQKGTCPFNVQHIVPLNQMNAHISECMQRKTFENLKSREELSTSSHSPDSGIQRVVSSDNWDDEPDVPTYNAKKVLESKPVLRNIQGAPPSERKKFREEERLRLMDMIQ